MTTHERRKLVEDKSTQKVSDKKLRDFIRIFKDVIKDIHCEQGDVSVLLDRIYADNIVVHDILYEYQNLHVVLDFSLPICTIEFVFTRDNKLKVLLDSYYDFHKQSLDMHILTTFAAQFDKVIIALRFEDPHNPIKKRLVSIADYLKKSVADDESTPFAFLANFIIRELELRHRIEQALEKNDRHLFNECAAEFKRLMVFKNEYEHFIQHDKINNRKG